MKSEALSKYTYGDGEWVVDVWCSSVKFRREVLAEPRHFGVTHLQWGVFNNWEVPRTESWDTSTLKSGTNQEIPVKKTVSSELG